MRVAFLNSVGRSACAAPRAARSGCKQSTWTRDVPRLVSCRAAAGSDDEEAYVKPDTTVASSSASSAAPSSLPELPPAPSMPELPPAPSMPELPPPPETSPQLLLPSYTTEPNYSMEVTAEDIKAGLLDSLYGTERGLAARSELRAEINELISQLEAKNPTPNPTEVLDKLDGEWRLVYTSNSALLAVLGLGRLPLVTVGDMVQRIDSAANSVENKVNLSGPFSKTAISTVASFEVRSPKRLQLRLERGVVATPELTGDLDLPTSVSVLGQSIDLSQLKDSLAPIKDQAQGVFSQLNQLVAQVPELNIPIQNEDAQTWQLNTYVDDDLRIARGDRGAVFIYSRMHAA